jgi:hypothetical protein
VTRKHALERVEFGVLVSTHELDHDACYDRSTTLIASSTTSLPPSNSKAIIIPSCSLIYGFFEAYRDATSSGTLESVW